MLIVQRAVRLDFQRAPVAQQHISRTEHLIMKQDWCSIALRVLPLQFITIPEGVILKRGCEELKISGIGAADKVQRILNLLRQEKATKDIICNQFPSSDRNSVEQLLEHLLIKRFIVTETDAI